MPKKNVNNKSLSQNQNVRNQATLDQRVNDHEHLARFSTLSHLLLDTADVNHSASIMNLQLLTARPVRARVHAGTISIPETSRVFNYPGSPSQTFESTIRYYDGITTLEVVQQLATDGPSVSPFFLNPVSTTNRFSKRFENDLNTIACALRDGQNIYELNLRHLCELRLRTLAFSELKGFRLVTLVARLLIHCAKIGCGIKGVVSALNAIEDVYDSKSVPHGPAGHVMVCPPGVGKTTTELLYSFGYLDTDFLNKSVLVENPHFVDNLVKAGFSLFSNLWNWKQFTVKTFGILPNDLKASLESKFIYPSTLEHMRRKALANLKTRPGVWAPRMIEVRYDQEQWIAAFADMEQFIPTYVGFIEDGLMTHYLYMAGGY